MWLRDSTDATTTEGDNIMFADFGTAFDWTEFESDVTDGPPDAHTKLYVAPEVSMLLQNSDTMLTGIKPGRTTASSRHIVRRVVTRVHIHRNGCMTY